MEKIKHFIDSFMGTMTSTMETMSVFQMTGAVIWIVMVFSFFTWILYLVVSK